MDLRIAGLVNIGNSHCTFTKVSELSFKFGVEGIKAFKAIATGKSDRLSCQHIPAAVQRKLEGLWNIHTGVTRAGKLALCTALVAPDDMVIDGIVMLCALLFQGFDHALVRDENDAVATVAYVLERKPQKLCRRIIGAKEVKLSVGGFCGSVIIQPHIGKLVYEIATVRIGTADCKWDVGGGFQSVDLLDIVQNHFVGDPFILARVEGIVKLIHSSEGSEIGGFEEILEKIVNN